MNPRLLREVSFAGSNVELSILVHAWRPLNCVHSPATSDYIRRGQQFLLLWVWASIPTSPYIGRNCALHVNLTFSYFLHTMPYYFAPCTAAPFNIRMWYTLDIVWSCTFLTYLYSYGSRYVLSLHRQLYRAVWYICVYKLQSPPACPHSYRNIGIISL